MTRSSLRTISSEDSSMTRSDALNAANRYMESMNSMRSYNAHRAFRYIARLDYSIRQVKSVKLAEFNSTDIKILLDNDSVAVFRLIEDDILPPEDDFSSDITEIIDENL